MYRPTSPYNPPRPTSPYHPPQAQATPAIAPGTLTYTTSTGPDGRTVYHPFKAVPASYQTPNGVVHGIQWVPAEATQILPAGAQPATADFAASWERGGSKFDNKRQSRDWQREDEKRRKKKEEREARRMREEQELRQARDRDAQARERRKSFIAGNAPVAFPSGPPSAHTASYSTSPYMGSTAPYPPRDGRYTPGAGGHAELDRQFGELEIGGRPRKYSTGEGMSGERARTISGNFGSPPYAAPPGPYPRPYSAAGPHSSPYANPSPNMRAADVPPLAATGYPASPYSSSTKAVEPIPRSTSPYGTVPPAYGHPQHPRSRATTPIPGTNTAPGFPQPRSRATTPIPVGAPGAVAFPQPIPSPRIPDMPFMDKYNQPLVPDCFSRHVNTTHPFAPFDPIKIQDMDDFLERLPRLPRVLQSHDVSHHDWVRMVQDLSLAWAGKMPIPPERATNPPKRANIVTELLDTWNTAFFLPRGVEVVLYKGAVRYSGPKAGIADLPLSHNDDGDDDESTTSSEEESDDDPYYGASHGVGLYGANYSRPPAAPGYAAEVMEARRRRREERVERKRRRREKRLRRKQRARDKKFILFTSCVPMGIHSSMPGGFPALHGGHSGGY
ncbi:hypothetical protein AX17_000890 [Amanita inopinata Kibby_2008]|nr:hypothetical protein AX17_000890 [Amanita inopinata Kibby_2008]